MRNRQLHGSSALRREDSDHDRDGNDHGEEQQERGRSASGKACASPSGSVENLVFVRIDVLRSSEKKRAPEFLPVRRRIRVMTRARPPRKTATPRWDHAGDPARSSLDELAMAVERLWLLGR